MGPGQCHRHQAASRVVGAKRNASLICHASDDGARFVTSILRIVGRFVYDRFSDRTRETGPAASGPVQPTAD